MDRVVEQRADRPRGWAMVAWALTVVYALSLLVASETARAAWSRRAQAAAGTPLVIAAVGVAGWSASAMVITRLPGPEHVRQVAAVGIAGQCLIVIGYVGLTTAIKGRLWRPSRRQVALLFVEPILAVAAAGLDGAFFGGVGEPLSGVWRADLGPLYWAHITYSYVVLLFFIGVLVRRAQRRGAGFSRRVAWWVLAITVPPIIANVIAIGVLHSVDPTLVGSAVSTAVAFLALVRRSTELLPVARAQLIDTLSDGVVVLDRHGVIADANAEGRRLIAAANPRLGGPEGAELAAIDPAFPRLEKRDMDFIFVSEPLHSEFEMRSRVIRDAQGAHVGWTVVSRDVTEARCQARELERLRVELLEQSVRDALTGLHNRRHLREVLERTEAPASVALIDVDHFKRVNDTFGHAAGDQALICVARVLEDGLGPDDVLARYGGEEFVLLMPGAVLADAVARVERLRRLLRDTPVDVGEQLLRISFSAGVAAHEGDPGALLEAADRALYDAKRNGRDRVEVAAAAIASP